jgi:hypothetical protein
VGWVAEEGVRGVRVGWVGRGVGWVEMEVGMVVMGKEEVGMEEMVMEVAWEVGRVAGGWVGRVEGREGEVVGRVGWVGWEVVVKEREAGVGREGKEEEVG